MASTSIKKVLSQLTGQEGAEHEGFSELTPEEAEELAGGATDANIACAENRGCPISNTSCGSHPS
jgi:hypothetical protein